MRTRSLEQFSASAEQPFAPAASGPPAVRVHGIPFSFLINPRLWSAIRFADVRADRQRLQIVYRRAAVIALVRTPYYRRSGSRFSKTSTDVDVVTAAPLSVSVFVSVNVFPS